jgi:hypothetical protein
MRPSGTRENKQTNNVFTINNFDLQGPLCIINFKFWNFF